MIRGRWPRDRWIFMLVSDTVETCKLICHEVELPDSLKDADFEMYVYECSKCGEPMFSDYNYCPNCGRKVVD